MNRIYSEWSSNDEFHKVMIKSLINEFAIKLFRGYKITDTSNEKESRTLKKVKQSISFIKKNYTRDISLDEIASVAGLSRYHFCREFKKATDLTPIEFINRMRCEYAKTLLESHKYSVSEISAMVGFTTSATAIIPISWLSLANIIGVLPLSARELILSCTAEISTPFSPSNFALPAI